MNYKKDTIIKKLLQKNTMDYVEWTEIFLKNKDLLKREIVSIETKADTLLIHKKHKDKTWDEIAYALGDTAITQTLTDKKTWIVLSDTKESVEHVIERWDTLKAKQDLTILFVNLRTDTKWAVNPFTHAKIAENPQTLFAIQNNQQN